MLVDRETKKTYSCRQDAIRSLGEKTFKMKVKTNNMDYVQCTYNF